MQFKKTLPYNFKRNLRRAVLTTGLAGATLVGCHKNNIEPTRDVELEFGYGNYDNIEPKNIKKYARDKSVRHIYLVLIDGDYSNISPNGIVNICNNMEQRIKIAPDMISGKGNYIFQPGYAVRADSLRFVSWGFTVNQHQK